MDLLFILFLIVFPIGLWYAMSRLGQHEIKRSMTPTSTITPDAIAAEARVAELRKQVTENATKVDAAEARFKAAVANQQAIQARLSDPPVTRAEKARIEHSSQPTVKKQTVPTVRRKAISTPVVVKRTEVHHHHGSGPNLTSFIAGAAVGAAGMAIVDRAEARDEQFKGRGGSFGGAGASTSFDDDEDRGTSYSSDNGSSYSSSDSSSSDSSSSYSSSDW
jgi:hypothetical protein